MARVTIIPEARGDIVVTVTKANSRLPLKITRIGDIKYDDLPQVVVHMPRNARVGAGGAVFGAIGPGDSVDLGNSGCGDWTVADQTGPLHVHVSGSGDVSVGR